MVKQGSRDVWATGPGEQIRHDAASTSDGERCVPEQLTVLLGGKELEETTATIEVAPVQIVR